MQCEWKLGAEPCPKDATHLIIAKRSREQWYLCQQHANQKQCNLALDMQTTQSISLKKMAERNDPRWRA